MEAARRVAVWRYCVNAAGVSEMFSKASALTKNRKLTNNNDNFPEGRASCNPHNAALTWTNRLLTIGENASHARTSCTRLTVAGTAT